MVRPLVPARVLASLGLSDRARLGSGAEASVYALDERRVARIHGGHVERSAVVARATLLNELARGAASVPFAIPEPLGIVRVQERLVTIERRLPGQPLARLLETASGTRRRALIRSYLAAASRIADLGLERSWYGELASQEPIRASTFRAYLRRRAQCSLAAAGRDFTGVDPTQLAAALPEPARPELTHLDAFPGNMLAAGGAVTAVLDFGTTSIMGDRRIDPLAAAAYLEPAITPSATPDDRRTAEEWLREHALTPLYEPVRRWLGAYWSFATDDVRLSRWCRRLLLTSVA